MKIGLLLILILLIPAVNGVNRFTQDYNNFLTRSIADRLYCSLNNNCTTDTIIVTNITADVLCLTSDQCYTSIPVSSGAGDKWIDDGTQLTPNSSYSNDVLINGSLIVQTNKTTNAIKLKPILNQNGYAQIQFHSENDDSLEEGNVLLQTHRNLTTGELHQHFSIYSTNNNNNMTKRFDLDYNEDLANWSIQNIDVYSIDARRINLNDTLYIDNQRRVGINDEFPSSELDIDDGGGVGGTPELTFNAERATIGYNGGTASLFLEGGSAKGIEFFVDGTFKILDFNTDGTSVMDTNLTITDALTVDDAFYVLTTNLVGIGDSNPSTELDVDDGGGVGGSPFISFNAERAKIGYEGANLRLYGGSSKGIELYTDGTEKVIDIGIDWDTTITGKAFIDNVFGELWGHDNGVVDMNDSGIYYNITGMQTGLFNAINLNTNHINISYDGIYKITNFFSFSGTPNNEYHISISLNGVQQDKCHGERVIGTGGDVGSAGFTCYLELNASDILKSIIENVDSAGDPTIHDINLNILRIGN